MPRVTVDELQGYEMQILEGEKQAMDGGMPIFNGSGEPRMEPIWVFVFSLVAPGINHVVKFTITAEGKDDVVRALTGVVPATTLHLPAGLEL